MYSNWNNGMNAKVIGTGQGRGHGSKWLSEFESSIVELSFKPYVVKKLIANNGCAIQNVRYDFPC